MRALRKGRRPEALACVIGSMDLVRPLGLAGIRSAVVAPPTDIARWSRFTAETLPWADPAHEPERLVDVLLEFGRRQPAAPALYYGTDWDLLAVSRGRERLRPSFRFVIASSDLVEDLADKERFRALAQRLELPVPPSRPLGPEAPEDDDLGLTFPVVVKPLTRQNGEWEQLAKGAKALLVNTPNDLREIASRLAEAGIRALAQTAVLGPETRVESYHAYVDEAGMVVGEFAGRKLRTYPITHGISTALITTDREDVIATGRDLVTRIGLRGVTKFDFKRDDSGRLWLLEVNPRFNLWHHLGAKAGVNLPALVYRDLVGLPRSPVPRARPGVRWFSHRHDAYAARAAGIPLRRWLPWALRSEAKSMVSLDDPLPILMGAAVRLGAPLGLGPRARRR